MNKKGVLVVFDPEPMFWISFFLKTTYCTAFTGKTDERRPVTTPCWRLLDPLAATIGHVLFSRSVVILLVRSNASSAASYPLGPKPPPHAYGISQRLPLTALW